MKLDLSNPFDKNKAITYLDKLIQRSARIELREFKAKRTIDQNSYFHVCCKLLGDYAGYTVDEMKIIIKDQLEWMSYMKNGHRFYRSSSDLDKGEFTNLIEFTRQFGQEHGCYLPTSEEFINHQFELMK